MRYEGGGCTAHIAVDDAVGYGAGFRCIKRASVSSTHHCSAFGEALVYRELFGLRASARQRRWAGRLRLAAPRLAECPDFGRLQRTATSSVI